MSASQTPKLNLLSFKGEIKTLHLTWIAFFITFLAWFNHAPLMASIRDTLGLSDQEVKTILILNVAFTIPARILIGMLVDKFGPRAVYSILLAITGVLCMAFSLADDFETLALMRFLMGFIGAGFVIGIRLVGEWFPAKTVGVAEGIYGGWGNFGSAAAAMTLPGLALWFGGDEGWRYAIMTTGVIAFFYSFVFYKNIRNTPEGATYFKPKKAGAMEVSSKGDLVLYAVMKAPLFLTLALLVWKLSPANLSLLSAGASLACYIGLAALYSYQIWHAISLNKPALKGEVAEIDRYKFKQVAVLDLAYLATFGAELAAVSMLPLFFMDTFELPQWQAALVASGFAFMNLVARPGGGLLSDRFSRRKVLFILLLGTGIGFLTMSLVNSTWPLGVAVLAMMCCSFFVQAGEGAVFAMVPLVKRRMTGQIAGMVGAYGNVGAVLFLTVLSFVSPTTFFIVIGSSAVLASVISFFFLEEPEGHMAEVLPDGTVQLIEVS